MKRLLSVFIFILFISFISPQVALADSVTILPSTDTYLDTAGLVNSTYGSQNFLLSYYSFNLNIQNMGYIFLRFPLDTIPAGATISSAKLYLYMYESSGASPITITVSTIDHDWPLNVTLQNQPMPGSDVSTLDVNSVKEYKIWDVTSIVKAWQLGSAENYGLFVWKKSPQNSVFVRKFYSLNRGNSATNPKLVVSYVPKVRLIIPTLKPITMQVNPSISLNVQPKISLSQSQSGSGSDKQNVIISDIKSSDVTQSDVLITWKTNANATSWVFFGMATKGDKFDQKTGQDDSVTSHALNLPFLTPKTKYSYKIMSKGANGVGVFSPINYFTIASFDKVSPEVSSPTAVLSPTSLAPSSQSSQLQLQNLPSLFLGIKSINMTKVVGILLILLGLTCVAGVILIHKLNKKAQHNTGKEIDKVNEKKLKEGGEDE